MLFGIFIVTGYLMLTDFPEKEALDSGFRTLMRSRHVYILLSAIVNILLGIYAAASHSRWAGRCQFAGSALIVSGSSLLAGAFFSEVYSARVFTVTSATGIFLILTGTVFHLPAIKTGTAQ